MKPTLDRRIVECIEAVRHWYAQDPARVDFDVPSYQAETRGSECFICRLVNRDPQLPPHVVIAEDERFIAFLDRFPKLRGHIQVCPKRHVEHIFGDMPLPEYLAFQAFAYRIGQAITRAFGPERIYLCSFGSAELHAHVHCHLLPLPSGVPTNGQQAVTMISPVTGVLALAPQEQEEIAGKLEAALKAREDPS